MGLRGPKRTPTKILEMRGSWLAQRREAEVKPPKPVKMPAPDWLSDDAKKIWRKVVAQLQELSLISRIDTNALGRYCALFVQWKKALDFVEQHGQTWARLSPPTGDAQPRQLEIIRLYPQVQMMMTLSTELSRLEHAFGLTPSGRASLGATLSEAGDQEPPQGKSRFFA